MLIEYVLNGKRKEVRAAVGKALIKVKAAREVQPVYITRDMADQPKVQKIEAVDSITGIPVSEEEVDSAGDVWSPDMHVATKLQNKDGTWRKKPGAAQTSTEE